ncbi:MAG: hypothetical protein Q8P86_03535 [bacterium]|nr:hypothetical protein [bacterium]
MTKVINKTLYELKEARIFWIALACLGLSLAFYAYFISMTVFNIVERKSAKVAISELNSELAFLETEYMELNSSLTMSLVLEQGFREVNDVKYASRGASREALSFENAAGQ